MKTLIKLKIERFVEQEEEYFIATHYYKIDTRTSAILILNWVEATKPNTDNAFVG